MENEIDKNEPESQLLKNSPWDSSCDHNYIEKKMLFNEAKMYILN
jgi:hypothetical protein